jgi:hypothetical protein
LVQLPLVVLLYIGFFRGCLIIEENEKYDSNKKMVIGQYDLHNYLTGDNVGTITIADENNTLVILEMIADFTQGYNEILGRQYSFEGIELHNLVFQMDVSNKNKIYYFSNTHLGIILITKVSNDGYYKAIPDSIFNDKREFYLISIVDMKESEFIRNTTSVSLDKTILNNAHESIYTGIFFHE